MHSSGNKEQTAAEFAQLHWKEILAVSGTLAGAVIYLLIRYHKKRKQDLGVTPSEYLDILEQDAMFSEREQVPLILDLMPEVAREIPDAAKLTEELAKGLPTTVTGKKSRLRLFRGSPKQNMKDIGKIK